MRGNMLNYQGHLAKCYVLNIWKKNNLAVQIWEWLSSSTGKNIAVWHELKGDLMKTEGSFASRPLYKYTSGAFVMIIAD